MSDDPFEFGHDTIEIPFIWIPDDYDGPRPGYPWFEAGEMTLGAEQVAAWPPSSPAPRGGEDRSSSGDGERSPQFADDVSADAEDTEPSTAAATTWRGPDPAAGAAERARQYFDQS